MYNSIPKLFSAAVLLLAYPFISFAAPSVSGNTLSWPEDGWYQVQRADTYETICEGTVSADSSLNGGPCILDSSIYTVINHTSGERFENISASDLSATASGVRVEGNSISWPDDGWYQVQDADTYATVCEGGRSCDVSAGNYVVINHTTGERFQDVLVGSGPEADTSNSSAVMVQGQFVSWPDDGWYQVQDAGSYTTVCEGGTSCLVQPGNYVVINHTTGERFNDIVVFADNPGDIESIDTDNDGVVDSLDNCRHEFNPDQLATIGSAFELGDACDDEDSDGIFDAIDNCPFTSNGDQLDTDGNGVGNVCEGEAVAISDIEYFNEVVLGTEFGSGADAVRKWNQDVRYSISGEPTPQLEAELARVASELNSMIDIQLIEVPTEAEANLRIFFGSGEDYVNNYEPRARDFVAFSTGVFWLYWNGEFELTRGTIFIDTVNTTDVLRQFHTVREELTQALGIFNDSYSYPNSIFYQGFSNVTEFAPIDREVIQFMYSNRVSAGMDAADINRILGLN